MLADGAALQACNDAAKQLAVLKLYKCNLRVGTAENAFLLVSGALMQRLSRACHAAVRYAILDVPPWYECIFLGFQVCFSLPIGQCD